MPDPAFPRRHHTGLNRTLLLDMIADIGTNRFRVHLRLRRPLEPHDQDRQADACRAGYRLPTVIDAVGRCPLEDSGGPPGYMEMLMARRDPAHPRHVEVTEWPGTDFDANDVDRVQARKGRGRPGEIDVTPRARIGEAKAATEAPQAVERRPVLNERTAAVLSVGNAIRTAEPFATMVPP